jgi:hypothetical protein
MRTLKDNNKKQLDDKKNLESYTYNLSFPNIVIDTSHLFQGQNADEFLYKIDMFIPNNSANAKKFNDVLVEAPENSTLPKSNPIPIPNRKDDSYISSYSLSYELSLSNSDHCNYSLYMTNSKRRSHEIEQYIGINSKDGYLHNIYNVENCDDNWLATVYILDSVYHNFIIENKLKIKSLHLKSIDSSNLQAMNHFLYNSNLENVNSVDWSWLATESPKYSVSYSPNEYNTITNTQLKDSHPKDTQSKNKRALQSPNSNGKKFTKFGSLSEKIEMIDLSKKVDFSTNIKKKYGSRIITLLDDKLTVNNINMIINETASKLQKINFLISNNFVNRVESRAIEYNINSYIMHIALSIKVLETPCILCMNIPDVCKWDTQFINVLLLFSLIFNEVYIYKFQLSSNISYLICKNKKKINAESVFKKLVQITCNKNFNENHNIFSSKLFDNTEVKDWLRKVLNIYNNVPNDTDGDIIKFNNILEKIDNTLKMNTSTFL